MHPMYCSSCGKPNASDAKFCNECAKPLFYAQPVQIPIPVNKKKAGWWESQSKGIQATIAIGGLVIVFSVVGLLNKQIADRRPGTPSISLPTYSSPSGSSRITSRITPNQPSPEYSGATTREDETALAKVKAKLERDYPNDSTTQDGVYKMQVEAYLYMKSVPPSKIKDNLIKDYPNDYLTQKGVYNMQVEAKEFMDSLQTSKIKQNVMRDYPNDFVTQKGVYNMQVEAQEYMDSLPASKAKDRVQRAYPNDYVTQKGVYNMDSK
jgi:hypothetical protein